MAPFVSKRKAGKVISRQGWKTNQFSTPKIAPERVLIAFISFNGCALSGNNHGFAVHFSGLITYNRDIIGGNVGSRVAPEI